MTRSSGSLESAIAKFHATAHLQGALRARGIRPDAELERFPFDAAERLPDLGPRIVLVDYQMRKLPLTWSMPSM
jgi:hypothetical protein